MCSYKLFQFKRHVFRIPFELYIFTYPFEMKFTKTALLVLFFCFIQHSILAQSYFQDVFPNVWKRATNYTLEVAEAMPLEKYSYRPTEGSMTFQEQLIHLVQNLSFLSEKITGERPDFLKGKKPEALTREETIVAFIAASQYVSQLVEQVDEQTLQAHIAFGGEEMPKENIFYLMRDHTTHHRAQAILYLRLNGIKAPLYRGW